MKLNWAIKPANDPSKVRFDPGHFRTPIFDPTIDAAESPIPTLIIPLNCAKRLSKKNFFLMKSIYYFSIKTKFTIIS